MPSGCRRSLHLTTRNLEIWILVDGHRPYNPGPIWSTGVYPSLARSVQCFQHLGQLRLEGTPKAHCCLASKRPWKDGEIFNVNHSQLSERPLVCRLHHCHPKECLVMSCYVHIKSGILGLNDSTVWSKDFITERYWDQVINPNISRKKDQDALN